MKNLDRVFAMTFAQIYPLYLSKVEKKGRTKKELDEVIRWLTGYSPQGLAGQIKRETTLKEFMESAPRIHPNAHMITGVICGYRVEEIEHPLMQKLRYMDKLVDELARGRAMEKILRS